MQPFVFCYWDREDRGPISDMIEAWRSLNERFTVFGDADVLPLLQSVQPDFVETYNRIRIPAAKSDGARLLLLHRYGGLFVDCHVGPTSNSSLRRLFDRMDRLDHVFVNRRTIPNWDQRILINGLMMSRPQTPHLLAMARQAMANLSSWRNAEQRDGFMPYSIWMLCGAFLVTNMTLQPGSRDIRPDLADRMAIIKEEDFPAARDRFSGYRAPGMHWSEREKTELLFEPSAGT